MSKRYSSALQLCHAFVHNLTEAGRCDNTSFSNDVFYSYKTPIAARVETPVRSSVLDKNVSVILLATETFSQTTASHKSKLCSASANVYELVPARYIPTDLRNEKAVSDIHKLNVEFFTDQLHKALNAFINTTHSRIEKARELIRTFAELNVYTSRFQIEWDNSEPIAQALTQARAEIEAHKEKSAARKLQRNYDAFNDVGKKQYQARVEASLRKWRSGQTDKLPMSYMLIPIALRVKQYRIETSRAASMPRRDAARIWPLLKAMRQSCVGEVGGGEPIMAHNPTMRFGQFTGVHVAKDFIRIGCHTIPWPEVVDVAKQLGLDVTGVDDATPAAN